MDDHLLLAFGLTALAGLCTGIGSALAFFTKATNKTFLSGALGFSGGVMIYVSLVEILPKACEAAGRDLGMVGGRWAGVGAFFGGMILMAMIDRFVPDEGNPHEAHAIEEMDDKASNSRLMRMGLVTALAIGIHNFPEGFATFMSALTDPVLGVSIAVAIALHNIPEGIAVSVPVYFATGSRKKAFWMSFLSGVSEPIGALLGYVLLRSFISDLVFGLTFGAVAGVMVFISLDELLPTAREYSQGHVSVYGLISGMGLMALSLLLFL
ncbi:MAG: zinc transporter ZupT [Proteobacteria bacterium]|nr:zinc transporter ZupT [Pseudomonadota bacterium]